jgi:hypothetical protein
MCCASVLRGTSLRAAVSARAAEPNRFHDTLYFLRVTLLCKVVCSTSGVGVFLGLASVGAQYIQIQRNLPVKLVSPCAFEPLPSGFLDARQVM